MRTDSHTTTRTITGTVRAFFAALGIGAMLIGGAGLTGCSAEGSEADVYSSEELTGADDSRTGATVEGESSDAITARYPTGTRIVTTTNVNLRRWPANYSEIMIVMPEGSALTIANDPGPLSGWYRVTYGAYTGWASGEFLALATAGGGSTGGGSTGGGATGGGTTPTDVGGSSMVSGFNRARAGVGFSYWWGHGRWTAAGPTSATAGVCRGGCPSCSHSGSYGADCSGYVAKIWQVPGNNDDITQDSHPYTTDAFYSGTGNGNWARVSRNDLERGDALVYRSGSSGHIVLVESGDPWGNQWVYEARGCSTGVVHNSRAIASNYRAIRRTGW